MSTLTHWRRHARSVGRDLGLSRMGTGTKVALGLGALFAAFWVDANVIGIGLDKINPLGRKTPKTPAPAASAFPAAQPNARLLQTANATIDLSGLSGPPQPGSQVPLDIVAIPGNTGTFTMMGSSAIGPLVWLSPDGTVGVVEWPITASAAQVSAAEAIQPGEHLLARVKGR